MELGIIFHVTVVLVFFTLWCERRTPYGPVHACLSVCRVFQNILLEHIVPTMISDYTISAMTLDRIVATMVSDHTVSAMTLITLLQQSTLDTILAFDATVAFVIPLVTLLTSLFVTRDEHF
jgi:hypothetical protein